MNTTAFSKELYATTNTPQVETAAITATGNVKIQQATVVNTSGGAIDLTVKIDGVRVLGPESIPNGTTGQVLGTVVDQSFGPGEVLTVLASAANLELRISGVDVSLV